MATIPYSVENIDGNVRVATWTPLANGDVGQPYAGANFSDCSVQVYGTFGTGGNARLQGSLESGTPSNWVTLTDPQGTALNMTTAALNQVLQRCYTMRPNITAGDGTTSLTVKIAFTSSPQRWRAQE